MGTITSEFHALHRSSFNYPRAGKIGETPWNNDLHHKHTLENENNYYKLLAGDTFKPHRDRNPFNLSLEEVVNDEGSAKKFAVRQTNGIRPVCSHRSEPDTARRMSHAMTLMRETNEMLSSSIPALRAQVASTNERIVRLERRRSAQPSRRSASALSPKSGDNNNNNNNAAGFGSRRQTYTPGDHANERNGVGASQRGVRAKTAMSRRSVSSSVMLEASQVLGKASGLLNARPQTAKTTKTVLSHRNRHGWSGALRDGDIIKHAGKNMPLGGGADKFFNLEVDHATGEVRKQAVKPRPSTAMGLRQPSCRRMPGYKAPLEDYGPNPPGEAADQNATFYHRPEDLDIVNPGHK